jgi:hypothetical protein
MLFAFVPAFWTQISFFKKRKLFKLRLRDLDFLMPYENHLSGEDNSGF